MKPLTLHISPQELAKLLKAKMNGAARWRRLKGRPLLNPPSNTPSSSSQNLLHESLSIPSSLLEKRLRDVFPLRFESNSSSSRQAYLSLAPNHLKDLLARPGNGNVESTVVKSAWYGKQTKSPAKHEFIIICVEDLDIPGLKNCIAVDRSQGIAKATPGKPTNISALSSGTAAVDTFRVSHDGDLDRFLRECQLTPYADLEELFFQPNEPLLFRDLVSLVLHISDKYPQYRVFDTNCYWFTGLIWECMREMRPTATHVRYGETRGKNGIMRCSPSAGQVRRVLGDVTGNIEHPQNPNDSTLDAWEMVSRGTIGEEIPVAGDAVETDEVGCPQHDTHCTHC